MPCQAPNTRYPGTLFWAYTQAGNVHTASMHLIVGTVLTDIVNLRIEAERIAQSWAAAVYSGVIITGWGIRLQDGTVYYQENFVQPAVGSHVAVTGLADAYSKTITMTGQGVPSQPGRCRGQFRFEFFVGRTYQFGPGQKHMTAADDNALSALQMAFDHSTYGPADFYGQQGEMRAVYPIQYNGHTQKHLGT